MEHQGDNVSRRPRRALHLHIPHSNLYDGDLYLEAMHCDQMRMLCTESDNHIGVRRVPPTFVELIMPRQLNLSVHREMEIQDGREEHTQSWADWLANIAEAIEAFCRRHVWRRHDRDGVPFLP